MHLRQNNHHIGRGNSSNAKPGVRTITLSSGLTIRTVRRTAFEIRRTEVQISKGIGRGKTPYERLKTRQHVVRALEPQIAMSGMTKLDSMSELATYDIADDVLLLEQTLLAIQKFARTFDMESIFIIPNVFDICDPLSPHQATCMSNLLTDWVTADLNTVLCWQEFLLAYGSAEDIESNNWMEETLYLSMEADLKAEVISDMQDVHVLQRGAVTLFYMTLRRVAIRHDHMSDWVKTFDLCAFANQNVSRAALSFKAVVRMIGERDLPPNTVHCLLSGMSQATNASFKQLCIATDSMNSIFSFKRKLGSIGTMEHTFSVLRDLEDRYVELLYAKSWEGIGHEVSACLAGGTPTIMSGSSVNGQVDIRPKNEGTKHASSFTDWVKTKYCHHCGENGHIRPICPVLLRSSVPSYCSQHALNISHTTSPKPCGKRRSEHEARCHERDEMCQDRFYKSFISTASNAKNTARSTFQRRFVRTFVEAFKLTFSESTMNDQQVYRFRHHFPTAVAEVVTYIGSSSLQTIESMIHYYQRMYVAAYASIFHAECADSNCDLASSLNSQFRRLFGKAFAEDDSLRELFDQQEASSSKSKWELKQPHQSVENHWRAATAYAASSVVDQHSSAAGVSLAAYHIISASAFTGGPALSSTVQGSSPQVNVVPSVNIAPLVSSNGQHDRPTSIGNGNVQCAIATIAVPSHFADKDDDLPSIGQDVPSNSPVVSSTYELEVSHVPSIAAPTKPSISEPNVSCFAAVEITPSHNTLVSSHVSNAIIHSVPSHVYLNGHPKVSCPHLRKSKVSAALVPISQLWLSSESFVPAEYDFGRPPPWPDPAGLILAMWQRPTWPDPVGLFSVPYCLPGTLPPPWPDPADWNSTRFYLAVNRVGLPLGVICSRGSICTQHQVFSYMCTQDDRRVQYGLLQWEHLHKQFQRHD